LQAENRPIFQILFLQKPSQFSILNITYIRVKSSMSIISKYIVREHIGPFFLALLTIIFLFILNILFRDLGKLLGKGLSTWVIIKFFIYNLAWIMAVAVPMSVLVASLMAFGRLSSDNEIIALKASGVHLYRLLMPLLLVALALTFTMERFGNIVLPDFNYRFSLLYSAISRKRPTLTLEPNVFQTFKDQTNHFILLAQKIQEKDDVLEGVYIIDKSDVKCSQTIIAETGKLIYSEEQDRMIIRLFDGEVHKVQLDDLESYQRWTFQRQDLSVAMSNKLQESSNLSRGNRAKSAKMMQEDVKKNEAAILVRQKRILQIVQRDFIKYIPNGVWFEGGIGNEPYSENGHSQEDRLTRKAGSENMTADGSSIERAIESNMPRVMSRNRRTTYNIHQQIMGERRTIEHLKNQISGLWVEIYKKYSIPVTCIIFVLLGVPLGIMTRQGGAAIGGSLGLVFFILFWAFLIGGEQLADRRLLDPLFAMWGPNIIMGIGGGYLVMRSVKEATFVPWDRWFRKKRNRKIKKA
jgi:lipopolysaccharide export system permease protein